MKMTTASTNSSVISALVLLLLSIIWVWFNREVTFFWDTINYSRQAHFYFSQPLSTLFVPTDIDAGHPPLFSLYLALGWYFFGKTLLVSHLLMLPIIWGILWYSRSILLVFVTDKSGLFSPFVLAFVSLITETCLLGHAVLVSAELLLFLGFLMALSALLQGKKWLLSLGITFMIWVNLRGVLLSGGLLLWYFFYEQHPKGRKTQWAFLWPTILVGCTVVAYYVLHYIETGWLFSTPSEKWVAQRTQVGTSAVIRNVAILGFRLVEYGKIVLIFLFLFFWKKYGLPSSTRKIIGLFICLMLTSFPVFVFTSNPVGNRYLLPFYFLLNLLLICYLPLLKPHKKRLLPIAIIVVNLAASFIIYPKKMAQSWSTTPAHWAYYDLRKNALLTIEKRGISRREIGTEFPNKENLLYTDLIPDTLPWAEKNFLKNDYFLYSNVMNDLSDAQIDSLHNSVVWQAIWQQEKHGVCFVLYKRRK